MNSSSEPTSRLNVSLALTPTVLPSSINVRNSSCVLSNRLLRAVVQLVPLRLSSSAAALLLLLAIGGEVVLSRDVALRATFLDVFGLGHSVFAEPEGIGVEVVRSQKDTNQAMSASNRSRCRVVDCELTLTSS